MSTPIALPPALLAALFSTIPQTTNDPPMVTLDGTAAALAALAAAGSVSGTVAAGPTDGTLVLVTSLGSFAITSTTPLPLGSRLTIEVQPASPGEATIVALTPPSPPEPIPTTPPTVVDLGARLAATVVAAALPALPEASIPSTGDPLPDIAAAATAAAIGDAAPTPANPVANTPTAPAIVAPAAAAPGPVASPSRDSTQPAAVAPSSTAPVATTAGTGQAIPAAPAAPQSPAVPQSAAESGRDRMAPLPQASDAGAASTAASAKSAPVAPAPQPGPRAAAPPPNAAATAQLPASARPQSANGGLPSRSAEAALPKPPAASDAAATKATDAAPALRSAAIGARLAIRVVAVQVAGPRDPARPALVGIVRTSDSGETSVETPGARLRLASVPPLAPGSRIALDVLPGTPATVRVTVLANSPAAMAAATTAGQASPTVPRQGMTGPASDAAAIATPGSDPPVANAPSAVPAQPPSGPARPLASEPFVARILPQTAQPASPKIAAQMVVGTVIAERAPGPAATSLVATPLGLLSVAARLAAPPGTLLLLEIADPGPGIDTASPAVRPAAPKPWSSFEAALGALAHVAPGIAGQLHAELSTQGGEKLAAALLYLFTVLRGGSAAAWPGESVERSLAASGHGDVAKRLGEEIGAAQRLAGAPETAPWQVFVLPMLDGAAVVPLRLYLKRRDGGRKNGRDSEEPSRFVLEFELSRLGTLQLDGFVRRRRFDLALRSRVPLASALQTEISQIFHDRIAAAGLSGTIEFPVAPGFSVAPLDALRPPVEVAV